MRISLSSAKILKTEFEKEIRSPKWFDKLLAGDLYEFEESLHNWLLELYDKICDQIIKQFSKSKPFEKVQRQLAKRKGMKKLKLRPVELQLRTGSKVKYDSLYAKKP